MGVAARKKRDGGAKPKLVKVRREKSTGPHYGPVVAKLRQLREDHDPPLTGAQLSKKIGAPNQVWISRHENGNVQTAVTDLEVWAAGLDHEVAILFTPKGTPGAELLKAAEQAGPAATVDAIALLQAWPQLPLSLREAIQQIVASAKKA